MPEIEIRPAMETDIDSLIDINHHYTSDYVWQMDLQQGETQINVTFREIRLPRSVQVSYPREYQTLADDWNERSGLLVAVLDDEIVGYIGMMDDIAPKTTWATDLVVSRRSRRQGIGSALVLAAQEWATQRKNWRLVLEMQPKNFPAIRMARKLAFEFSGYNDRYYANHDIALFFAKWLS
jgi:GNAT superfamily N-acetyltransferase